MENAGQAAGTDAISASASSGALVPASTGIDETTGLASDFLNQFNEVVMLLDLVASGDESLINELDAWRPRTYEAHFTASGYADRAAILENYRVACTPVRRRLDALADELSAVVLAGIVFLMTCRGGGAGCPSVLAGRLATDVRRRLKALDAVVHAGVPHPSQDEVSALFRRHAA